MSFFYAPLRRERGVMILASAIMAGVLVLLLGGVVLSVSSRSSQSSIEARHNSQALHASVSALDAALVDLSSKTNVEDAVRMHTWNYDPTGTANNSGPAVLKLGNSCYNYWFGRHSNFNRFSSNPNVTNDLITVHISAASPYIAPGDNENAPCDVRQVVNTPGSGANAPSVGEAANTGRLLIVATVEHRNGNPIVRRIDYKTNFSRR